jgi:hypothetical protein
MSLLVLAFLDFLGVGGGVISDVSCRVNGTNFLAHGMETDGKASM